MLRKLGYFHYGSENRSHPTGSLLKALEEAGGKPQIEGSLVVLPEAFNLRVPYEENARPEFEANIEKSLQKMATDYQVVFVAGCRRDPEPSTARFTRQALSSEASAEGDPSI